MHRNRNHMKRSVAYAATTVMVVLMLIGLIACAKGTDLAGRTEAFQAMTALGFKFDYTLASTEYGGSQDVIVVTGPMIGPKVLGGVVPPKNGETYTQYKRVVMKRDAGKWVVAETTLR